MPTPKPKNSIKYGDIFQIGNGHIVACGDGRDKELVARVIGKNKIAAYISDYPYGVSAVEGKAGFSKFSVNKKILNDDISSETEYAKFTHDLIMPVIPHLTRKNMFYLFNSDKQIFALREGMKKAGVHFSQLVVWVKNHCVIGRKDYLPMHELVAVGWYGTHAFKKSQDKSVLYCPKPNKSPLHPTQKPISLLRRLILNSTSIGDYIYDPCAGSGSLGIACEQTKRKSILIELDPEYVRTILDRFERTLNIKAKKIYEKR